MCYQCPHCQVGLCFASGQVFYQYSWSTMSRRDYLQLKLESLSLGMVLGNSIPITRSERLLDMDI